MKAVPDEGTGAARAAREQRIALTLQIWNSTKVSLQRVQESQAPLLAPLQTLVSLIDTDGPKTASTASNCFLLFVAFEA